MIGGDSGAFPGTPAATGMSGSYFVPLDFRREVESALKYAGPMLEVSNVLETPTARLFSLPSDSDAISASGSGSGEFMSENQSVSDADVAGINQQTLGGYLVSSKMVKMSISLLEDAGFDAPSYIAGRLGLRLGRAMEPMFTTGSGNGQPTGFITGATQAAIAVGASQNDGISGANSIGSSDVAALEASVDYAYRKQGAIFMCNPSTTLQAMRAQRDQKGALLFPGLQSAELRLLNYPLVPNPNMDQLQTQSSSPQVTRNVLAFGCFKKFILRFGGGGLILKRLDERFAEYRQVAFIAYYRVDSNLLDGGGGAIKYLSTVY
jgi:HK97 family phage major capsid protein